MNDDEVVAHRDASRARWARVAGAWGEHRSTFQTAAQPVSVWLVEALAPQPGHRVLELGAGPGDTGFLAAELIEPGGSLICSDAVAGMLDQARARAAQLGLRNVEFRPLDAEWIDLATATVDGVIARWVTMLLPDPAASLREVRRVLRPGGRVALAAWTDPADNPWTWAATSGLIAMGAIEPPDLDEPGMFAARDAGFLPALLRDAGFTDVVAEQLELRFAYADLDAWWDTLLAMSMTLADHVGALTPAQRDDLRDAVDAGVADHVAADGSVLLPGRTHVVAACA